MRKAVLFLSLLFLFFLAACGDKEENNTTGDNVDEVVDSENNNAEKSEVIDNEEQMEDDETDNSGKSLTNIEEILQKAAEAASNVNGVSLTGDLTSMTRMGGEITLEKTKLNGRMSNDPFVRYVAMEIETESGDLTETTEMEMYITTDAMYIYQAEFGQWMMFPLNANFNDLTSVVTDAQYIHFANYADHFTLTEAGNTYVLTLEGSGDSFKEVIFGGMAELLGEEGSQGLIDMVKDISGSYRLIFDKDTFHLVELQIDWEQSVNMGFGDALITEESTYKYSDYNDEAVIVPEEVLENAENIFGPPVEEDEE